MGEEKSELESKWVTNNPFVSCDLTSFLFILSNVLLNAGGLRYWLCERCTNPDHLETYRWCIVRTQVDTGHNPAIYRWWLVNPCTQVVLLIHCHLCCLPYLLLLLQWSMIRGRKVQLAWACFLQAACMDMDRCRYVSSFLSYMVISLFLIVFLVDVS